MFSKRPPDIEDDRSEPTIRPSEPAMSTRSSPKPAGGTVKVATIGPSITIRGDMSGDEDLIVQGRPSNH